MFRHDRLNSLAEINSAKCYLEIGVREGATLKKVNVVSKYGVDPLFRFDKQSFFDKPDERVELFEVASDQFFAELSPDVKFDLVFVDGLHQFEQVLRDILNAFRHCHAKSILVVDDTIPTSIAAATRNLSDLGKIMEATCENSKNWMGDVYKIFPFLHNFLLELEVATFPRTTTLHPQTVIWQKQGRVRKTERHFFKSPFFESYEDFLLNMQMANIRESEESLFHLLKSDLSSN